MLVPLAWRARPDGRASSPDVRPRGRRRASGTHLRSPVDRLRRPSRAAGPSRPAAIASDGGPAGGRIMGDGRTLGRPLRGTRGRARRSSTPPSPAPPPVIRRRWWCRASSASARRGWSREFLAQADAVAFAGGCVPVVGEPLPYAALTQALRRNRVRRGDPGAGQVSRAGQAAARTRRRTPGDTRPRRPPSARGCGCSRRSWDCWDVSRRTGRSFMSSRTCSGPTGRLWTCWRSWPPTWSTNGCWSS